MTQAEINKYLDSTKEAGFGDFVGTVKRNPNTAALNKAIAAYKKETGKEPTGMTQAEINKYLDSTKEAAIRGGLKQLPTFSRGAGVDAATNKFNLGGATVVPGRPESMFSGQGPAGAGLELAKPQKFSAGSNAEMPMSGMRNFDFGGAPSGLELDMPRQFKRAYEIGVKEALEKFAGLGQTIMQGAGKVLPALGRAAGVIPGAGTAASAALGGLGTIANTAMAPPGQRLNTFAKGVANTGLSMLPGGLGVVAPMAAQATGLT